MRRVGNESLWSNGNYAKDDKHDNDNEFNGDDDR